MSQTLLPSEIVVVDSGSIDSTLKIASRFPTKIVQLAPREFSFGRSLNCGLRHCTGEVVVIASAHVYPVDNEWLEELTKPFGEDARIALVYGRQKGDERTKYAEHQLLRSWFPASSTARQDHPFCNNANAAIRREVWSKIPYNEDLTGLEDLDWAKRALNQGYFLAYAAEAAVFHVHQESWVQIVHRYQREAIAHGQVYGEQSMGALEALGLASLNALADFYHAFRDGVLGQNLTGIASFRFAQFLGTYRGFRQKGPISTALKRRFYYPNSLAHREVSWGAESEKPSQESTAFTNDQASPIDISVPISEGIPIWPDSSGYKLIRTKRLEAGDLANVSKIEMDVHTGTHIDAPLHFLSGGAAVEDLPLHRFLGPCEVVDCGEATSITADHLAEKVPAGTKRLLLKTRNSTIWCQEFQADYVALTADGASWLVDHGVSLIANDYLSIQRYGDDPLTHKILLEGDVMILEGVDLSDIVPGPYILICMPLHLVGSDGAPARVALLPRLHQWR